jgi:hypothetical protein
MSLLLIALPVASSSDLTLSSEMLSSDDWSAQGITLSMQPLEKGYRLDLKISKFKHQSLSVDLVGIEFHCPQVREETTAYHCDRGELQIADSPYGRMQANASFSYFAADHFSLKVENLSFAKGRLNLAFEMTSSGWDAHLDAKQLHLKQLREQLSIDALPQEFELSGGLSFLAAISGTNQGLKQIEIESEIQQLNYSDLDGLQVAENGGGLLIASVKQRKGQWFGTVAVDIKKGQFYSDPFYHDMIQSPLHLKLNGQWSPEKKQLRIDQARLDLLPVVEGQGELLVDLSALELQRAKLQLKTAHLDKFYTTLVQPVVIGSMVDDMEVAGAIEADVEFDQGELNLFRARLKSVNLEDKRGVFALEGLQGLLAWSKGQQVESSQIEIDKGQIYKIPHGPVSIHAQVENSGISLLEPVDIPLLGGFIHIGKLESKNLFSSSPAWETSAEVKNLSLQGLASAFDWPAMSGELNGKLPAMHYQDQFLKLDGALQVDVFGGHIQVDNLMVKQPLGRVPELFAEAKLVDLDLKQITQTFSFGQIEGGLEGWVKDLHLLSWEPIAFRARFNSPENDEMPHRISQRAVDNLTAIGNGMGSGLQSTFLGIFKEFRYNRIELRAKLAGNLAELDGINHPDGGYYLVKGAGLPRIDVIARNRRVAWKTLLERLKNIRVEGMEVR